MLCYKCGAENFELSESCCKCGDNLSTQHAPLSDELENGIYRLFDEAEANHKSLQAYPAFYVFLFEHREVLLDFRMQNSLRAIIDEYLSDLQYCFPQHQYATSFDLENLYLAISISVTSNDIDDVIKTFC